MSMQLELQFNLTPGTLLYYSPYTKAYREECGGGLVFEIGTKPSCKKCASLCSGCVEMAINFGFLDYEDGKHLIVNPKLLKKIYRQKYNDEKTPERL